MEIKINELYFCLMIILKGSLMGKQINFYMSEKVQASFIEHLEQNHFLFLDVNSQILKEPLSSNVFGLYLYKQNYGNVVMRQDMNDIIDSIKSPVIQFSKTNIKNEKKKVLRGRLWISDQYYDEKGILVKKDEAFVKDYKMLTRWIKKNVPYQEIRKEDFFVKEYISDEIKELQNNGFILSI